MDTTFVSAEEAIEEIREGRMLIVVDDQDRENEGDLIMASEKVTPEAVNTSWPSTRAGCSARRSRPSGPGSSTSARW